MVQVIVGDGSVGKVNPSPSSTRSWPADTRWSSSVVLLILPRLDVSVRLVVGQRFRPSQDTDPPCPSPTAFSLISYTTNVSS